MNGETTGSLFYQLIRKLLERKLDGFARLADRAIDDAFAAKLGQELGLVEGEEDDGPQPHELNGYAQPQHAGYLPPQGQQQQPKRRGRPPRAQIPGIPQQAPPQLPGGQQ